MNKNISIRKGSKCEHCKIIVKVAIFYEINANRKTLGLLLNLRLNQVNLTLVENNDTFIINFCDENFFFDVELLY